MKKSFVILSTLAITGLLSFSCTTTQSLDSFENLDDDFINSTIEEYLQNMENNEDNFLIQEEVKTQDIENTIVFVDRPIYVPEGKTSSTDKKKVTGYDAVTESQKRATQKPEHYKDGTFYYQYNENFVYEVYAQPYHLSDIALQPGEVVIGTPLLSDDESIWELTAGVAKDSDTGLDVQHLFVKPAYSKQETTLIIITDKRVYHFRLKSYSETYMAMVRFTYPTEKNVWATKSENNGRSIVEDYIRTSDPSLLSFDYTIKYSKSKVPDFLPTRIYDDGQCTYIQVQEIVLQKKLPVLFNEKNEIINYSVHNNVFIIPRLIDKATLRLGNEKVTIEKKVTKSKD